MSNKKKALLVITLMLGAGVVAFVTWFNASPPAIDYQRAYQEIEARIVEGDRDPGAWETYTAFATRFEQEMEARASQVELERGLQSGMGAIDWAYVLNPEPDVEDAVAAGREVLAWYLESGLPEELGTVLALEGLRAPSLARDGAPTIEAELMEYGPMRRIALAESARLWYAIDAGDAAMAADASSNLFGLMELAESQPLLISLLVRVSIGAVASERIEESIRAGTMTPEVARALLPQYRAWVAAEPARTRVHIEADALLLRIWLNDLYAGTIDGSMVSVPATRIFWLNHKRIDEKATAYFNDILAYVNEGPVAHDAPDIPWDTTSRLSELRHTPLSILLPAMDRSARNIFQWRVELNAVLAHLAIAVYEEDRGELPASLDDLVGAGLLDALPSDTFSTDGVMNYRPDPNAVGGFELWSDGKDQIDNNAAGPPWPERIDDLMQGDDAMFPRNDEAGG